MNSIRESEQLAGINECYRPSHSEEMKVIIASGEDIVINRHSTHRSLNWNVNF